MTAGQLFAAAVSAACAASDFRTRRIPAVLPAAGILCGAVFSVLERRAFPGIVSAMLPGGLLTLLSLLSGGRIGMGDAVLFLMLGLYYEALSVWRILYVSLFWAAAAGILIKTGRRCGGSSRKPEMKSGKDTAGTLPFAVLIFLAQILLTVSRRDIAGVLR